MHLGCREFSQFHVLRTQAGTDDYQGNLPSGQPRPAVSLVKMSKRIANSKLPHRVLPERPKPPHCRLDHVLKINKARTRHSGGLSTEKNNLALNPPLTHIWYWRWVNLQ